MKPRTYFTPIAKPPWVKELPIDRMPEGTRLLEISGRSDQELGKRLSAMRLPPASGTSGTVEAAYQGAKDFGHGPSKAIRGARTGYDAKRESRTREAAAEQPLQGFEHEGTKWPAEGGTDFYDWLWSTSALVHEKDVGRKLEAYDGFTDQFHRPARAGDPPRACQAKAAATLVSLLREERKGRLTQTLEEVFAPAGWQQWRQNGGPALPEPPQARPADPRTAAGATERSQTQSR